MAKIKMKMKNRKLSTIFELSTPKLDSERKNVLKRKNVRLEKVN